jgi:hypothetical protein
MTLLSRLDPTAVHPGNPATPPLPPDVETLQAVLRNYPDGAHLHFGAPTRCPICGDFGLVDDVDLVEGVCSNQCTSCQVEWHLTIRALSTQTLSVQASAPGQPLAPPVMGRTSPKQYDARSLAR